MDSGSSDNRRASERELVLTRTYDAVRRRVFKAWTRAEARVHWWGPRGFTTPYLKVNPRVGGSWRSCVRAELDDAELWLGGEFREVVDSERLLFTCARVGAGDERSHETVVAVTLVDAPGGTTLSLRQGPFTSTAERDEYGDGWTSCLDRLGEYLATR